jgi:hypothetical protein
MMCFLEMIDEEIHLYYTRTFQELMTIFKNISSLEMKLQNQELSRISRTHMNLEK